MLFEKISVIYYLFMQGFIPGVLVIVYRRKGKSYEFLLVKSKVSNATTFPSGGLMLGETEKKSAERELLEETGIQIDNFTELPYRHKFTYKLPIKLKSIQKIFVAELKQKYKQVKPEESTQWVKWFNAREVDQKLTHKELKQTFLLVYKHIQ